MAFVGVAAIVGVVATGVGMYTQHQAAQNNAQAQKQAADYQQQLANRNAMIEGQNASAQQTQAAAEQSATAKQVGEEQDRASQNLLRAQEEKRKAVAARRASFISSGVLPSSQSADMIVGELGENLQTRIQDLFTQQSGRMAAIQSQGNSRYFAALQGARNSQINQTNAKSQGVAAGMRGDAALQAGKYASQAALINGVTGIGSNLYKLGSSGAFSGDNDKKKG